MVVDHAINSISQGKVRAIIMTRASTNCFIFCGRGSNSYCASYFSCSSRRLRVATKPQKPTSILSCGRKPLTTANIMHMTIMMMTVLLLLPSPTWTRSVDNSTPLTPSLPVRPDQEKRGEGAAQASASINSADRNLSQLVVELNHANTLRNATWWYSMNRIEKPQKPLPSYHHQLSHHRDHHQHHEQEHNHHHHPYTPLSPHKHKHHSSASNKTKKHTHHKLLHQLSLEKVQSTQTDNDHFDDDWNIVTLSDVSAEVPKRAYHSRYTIQQLMHLKIKRQTSNDIDMDPCKAGEFDESSFPYPFCVLSTSWITVYV